MENMHLLFGKKGEACSKNVVGSAKGSLFLLIMIQNGFVRIAGKLLKKGQKPRGFKAWREISYILESPVEKNKKADLEGQL